MNREEILTRRQALEQGGEFYFTGKPCKHGGVAKRRVSNYQCTCDKCRELGSERAKTYVERNSESVREYKRKWHLENKDANTIKAKERYLDRRDYFIEKARQYRYENKEKIQEYQRRWYLDNRESVIDRSRNRYANIKDEDDHKYKKRRYYLDNREKWLKIARENRNRDPEAHAERSRRWRMKNSERVREYQAKRRAAKRDAMPSWYGELDEFVIQEAYDVAERRLKDTGIEWHVDHRIPLQSIEASGFHCAANIQVIPKYANLSKGNKMIYIEDLEWMKDHT